MVSDVTLNIGIIGTGLIGGSLGMALKNKCPEKYRVYGYNRTGKNSQMAIDKGAIDHVCDSIEEITQISDVIIICTPLSSYAGIVSSINKFFTNDKVLSDVGSVKFLPSQEVLKNLHHKFEHNFIPCHPIAGKAFGGVENAEADLFEGKTNIMTFTNESSKSALVREIWSDVGAINQVMSAQIHDEIYARVSHLPQYISYVLKKYLFGKEELCEFMRLANSPFDIWKDIFHYNGENISKAKASFVKMLEIEKEKLCAHGRKVSGHNIQDEVIFASMIAKSFSDIIKAEQLKYAGTGYKSFTSILAKNVLQKQYSYSNNLENNILDFIYDIKNSDISRNF